MNRTFLIRAKIAVVVLSAAWWHTLPTFASIPITLDTTDGYTFSVLQRTFHLSGVAQLPLGPNFATTPTLVELKQQQPTAGTIRAIFPGQGGQTIQIDTGDPILFEYSAEGIPFQVRLTSLGTPGFGGGLGSTIEFSNVLGEQKGSGEGMANINLFNLGFENQINSMSMLLGNDGSFFAQHDLGVDLNGDATNETLTINNLILAIFTGPGESPDGFNYTVQPPPDDMIGYVDANGFPTGRLKWTGSGSANPNFGLTLDTVEWTMTQEIVIPAVPEPSGLVLLSCLVAGLTLARGRRPHAASLADFSR